MAHLGLGGDVATSGATQGATVPSADDLRAVPPPVVETEDARAKSTDCSDPTAPARPPLC